MLAKIKGMQKTHLLNSWLNLIFSSVTVVLVFIAVVINLLATPTKIVEEVVPRRIIKILEKKYKSEKPLSYLCGIYLDEYWR